MNEANNEYNTFQIANSEFIKEAPKETCRCGCSKRHAGICNPHYGMNKYRYFRKHKIIYEKEMNGKKCCCAHVESSYATTKPGGIRPSEDKPHKKGKHTALAVTGTLTINNSVVLAKIRHSLADGYIEWYFGDKNAALDSFKKATEYFEDMQYDEPSSYQHEVHNIYGATLYMMGHYKAALNIVNRGLIPYPNQLDSIYIKMLATEKVGTKDEISKSKDHYNKLIKLADFTPSLKFF